MELDRCAAVPYRKRIGANEYASFALVRSLFFFFFFLYFHRLSRFELTLCNSLLSIFYTLRSSSKNLQNHRSHFRFNNIKLFLNTLGLWDTRLIARLYYTLASYFRNERNLANLYSCVYTVHTSSPDGSIQSRTDVRPDGYALANIFHVML